MQDKNLFISLSDNSILWAEKSISTNALAVEKQTPVGYNQSPEQIFFTEYHQSGRGYNLVYCTVKHPFFVLIPEMLFDENNAEQFLMGIDLTGKKILYDKVSRNGVICIYTIDQEAYERIIFQYPNVILRHYASVLIDYTVKTGFTEQKNVVTVDLENHVFYLCISKKTDLMLCNKFTCKAPEDILYFLLYSLEQFDLKPEQTQLHISGMVSENTEALVLLKEYFEAVMVEELNHIKADQFKYQTAFFHQETCA